jgi:hypothetical protein
MPPPLHSVLSDIPRAVEDVVMTALAKEPRERFPSVQAFATAFARAAEGQGDKTFSYTATTVVEPERGSPPITPPFSSPSVSLPAQAASPWQTASAPTVQDTLPQERRTSSPRAAGTHTQTEPYLRPATPYIPPEVPRPRIGWAVFWRGLVLAVGLGILFFLTPLSYFLSPVGTLIFGFVFFMGGWWGAQKTGLLHAGLFVALWGAFWAVCLFAVSVLWKNVAHNFATTASDFTNSMPLIVVSIGLATCGAVLGGFIGRRIHRARQPIHPPAGGAGLV